MMRMEDDVILKVEDLATSFPTRTGLFNAVDGVSFALKRGKTLCVVGESGSGKSVTARSILQIVDKPGRIDGGSILLARPDGSITDLASLDPRGRDIRTVRGKEIAMIFQEPMSSLSPVHRIGTQIGETLRIHFGIRGQAQRERVLELLRQVEIPRPETAIDRYTFEFSGGMRQRVMIAMALACNPQVLIADEPTTALDVTTQAEILSLIKKLQTAHGMAVLFITHDMGVVAEIADDVLVMYRGKVMEQGPVEQIFHAPANAYTRGLIGSVVKLETKAEVRLKRAPIPEDAPPLLDVKNLSLTFPSGLKAVNDVSLFVRPGETLGIVGESGSGKTTMGRCLLRIYDPEVGTMVFRRPDGHSVDIRTADRGDLKDIRREVRMIFQDPVNSLSPRKTVGQIIAEPLKLAGMKGREREDRVALLQERRDRLAAADRLDHPHLGQAAITDAAFRDRLARPAVRIAVGHGARADDRPRPQRAGLGRMGDQRAEIEGHVLPRVRTTERLAVQVDLQHAVQLAVLPPVAQRFGGDEDRREGGGGLGLEKAEALGQLARNQTTQRHIVGQPDQADRRQRLFAARPHRHVAGDDDHLALQVAAPAFIGQRDRIARPQKPVRSPLIHQRIVPEAVGQFGPARLADERDVIHIGRAVRPLIGARQRRGGVMFVEARTRDRFMVQVGRQIGERGCVCLPIVERGLERGGDMTRIRVPGQVVRHDDQLAVTTLFQTGEFHAGLLLPIWYRM